jgi:DNA-binding response OmpR family regulator
MQPDTGTGPDKVAVIPTILVVDDEKTLRDMLEYNLLREGFRVLVAGDGSEALRLAFDEHPDLIILDVMLPGMSGFDVVRAVRRQLTVPVLMLSAREEEIDKVVGLELGADDYLTKPFSLRELLARVRAMLRRAEMIQVHSAPTQPVSQPASAAAVPVLPPVAATNGRNGGSPADEPAPVLAAGDLLIDRSRRSVQRGNEVISLKPKEFDLLAFLASHPQQVFSRETLLDRVWGYDFIGGTRTVDVHVRWLRSKLEPDAREPQYIQTVYGVGYRFG